MNDKYKDIIDLPHHVSSKRPQMSMLERAAQFSPFAALTGYKEAVEETGRLTDERPELYEDELMALNHKLKVLLDEYDGNSKVNIIYFEPDLKKSGGAYKEHTGEIKKIDEYERAIIMKDGKKILMKNILGLDF